MSISKMEWDTAEYLNMLTQFKHMMGYETVRQAEEELYPIRARKRQIKIIERRELEATIKKKKA